MFGGGLIDLIRGKMAWAAERQTILARNIANASTPGFTPSDLNEKAFGAFLKREANGAASAGASSLGGRGFGPSRMAGRALETKPDGETTPDGNGVNLERQMMKAAENSLEYQQAAALYRKAVGLWRTAIGGRGI
jgi:flagellar basal-body rod protein FlgB